MGRLQGMKGTCRSGLMEQAWQTFSEEGWRINTSGSVGQSLCHNCSAVIVT